MNGNVCKSAGVKIVCGKYNISLEQAMSFGDGQNDLDMLNAVGAGFAMANAPREVREAAPATTPETAENHTPETAQTEPAQTEAEHKAVTGENGGPGVVPTTAAQPAGDNAGAESPASPAQEENP